MDIQLEKYKLMEWLVSIKDELVISKLKTLKNSLDSKDINDELSDTEKRLIEAGLNDIKNGKTIPHEQVMKDIKREFGI